MKMIYEFNGLVESEDRIIVIFIGHLKRFILIWPILVENELTVRESL